ncbi:stalk domain-containing protein [Cohnella mopanensis]|uniref:stalk domain-containing protein n=1 Tax=Cohnella mopanensis TaxID=2911966 RepID=UPI001EF85E31|nr:stalk domain-containing protein [Cohnella mopanensis]
MKKTMFISTVMLVSFFFGTISSHAGPVLEEIKAYLNHEITFVLNGAKWQPADANGKKVEPITFNGTTYVPLRAVSQALGVPVEYDGVNKQIILGEKRDSVSFLSNTISLDKKSYYTSSVTHNASELKLGDKQYKGAFKLEEVSSNRKKLTIDFGKAYAKGHIVATANFNVHHNEMKFRVLNDNDEVLYEGTLTKEAPLVEADFNITGMNRYLSVDFVATVGGDSVGYVLLDDSWVK